MFEPSLALQTAIRAKLIASPAVTSLVPADRIRAGAARPDLFPTIILASGQTMFLGRASGGQLCARVVLDLHIWALDDRSLITARATTGGPAVTARMISGAVMQTLIDPPQAQAQTQDDPFGIDQWDAPAVSFMRDPVPELNASHAVMQLSGVVRWRV